MRWRQTEYFECHGSPIIQASVDSARITRRYLIRWEDYYRAQIDFLGYQYVAGDGPGGANVIHRVTPHYSYLPGQAGLTPVYFAQAVSQFASASACDHDFVTDQAKYTWGVMTVVYTPLTYEILPDTDPALVISGGPLGAKPDEATLARYVTILGAPLSRTVTLPRGLMKWVPEGGAETSAPVFESAGRAENGETVTVIHHLRPDLPRGRILAAMNTVNSTAFAGYAPETLLCQAPDYRPITHPDGARGYDVHFKFTWLPKVDKAGTARGHNWFLRFLKKATPEYDYRRMTVTGTGTGDAPYRKTDFANLFRPD